MAVAAGGVDELDRALAFCAGRDDDYAVHDNVVGRLNLEGVAGFFIRRRKRAEYPNRDTHAPPVR
jgi:hypothetical protein